MKIAVFTDTEVHPKEEKIHDIGAIRQDDATFHKASVQEWVNFAENAEYLIGHNILNHDLKFLKRYPDFKRIEHLKVVDTLYLSPLLFPARPYHKLLKDDKLQSDELNNPLNDAIKAKHLFYDEVQAFKALDEGMQSIFYQLLHQQVEFKHFFDYLDYQKADTPLTELIPNNFKDLICEHSELDKLIKKYSIELAYSLALIHCDDRSSISPAWVLKNYPATRTVYRKLRNERCLWGCNYCNNALDARKGLQEIFGFPFFREYDGMPLQEKAAQAALNGKSLLAVFPTGGGKSITFQLPALMSGKNEKGLTVVISPLQSLMKDQVDNLEKVGITESATINGLLDPIERAKSFERVQNGSVSLLYISPESLRSRSIERLLLSRNVVRFVIDEAHCFSAWGQDFRVDYLYIGDFIRNYQQKRMSNEPIPVSCFTATARLKVIEDIQAYFREKLSLELMVFQASAARKNLHYKVIENETEEDKYQNLRSLIADKNCPTIVYVSRTHKTVNLADRLKSDGLSALAYHGKMDSQIKTANQDQFIQGEAQVMVATSAFGMGVDKKDVGLVVHYEISDSLENYVQEAGRAGRDESIQAECYVLYNEEDLSKHFILLNQTKVSAKEIQQIWKAIKDVSGYRTNISKSALEIAREAGWDDSVKEIETRVKTAIAALEDAGYLKREQNNPKIFANSILSRNAQDAIDKIARSALFQEEEREHAIRIIKKLFSSKNRKNAQDEIAESRVDYISDHLGIVKEQVIRIIQLLREEGILADHHDLTAFISGGHQKKRSFDNLKVYMAIEESMLRYLTENSSKFDIKKLNEQMEEEGIEEVSPQKIKNLLNYWSIRRWIKKQYLKASKNLVHYEFLLSRDQILQQVERRNHLCGFIIDTLYQKSESNDSKEPQKAVEFSLHELKTRYESEQLIFGEPLPIEAYEEALFFLSKIQSLKIEGGFMVIYNQLTLKRLETDNRKRYKQEDYQKLSDYYESRVQQIHIVGEYARKMLGDYQAALQFVDDYFRDNYPSFLRKYFPGSRAKELKLKMTPAKFKQLFGELSPAQLSIINDHDSQYIVVAAGPGSGKTRVLVHKLASLLLMEDVKHEQLLMLTFSRAAATEFKKRLFELVGNAAAFVDIKTFHSFCFDLLGRPGKLEKSNSIINDAVERIRNKDVELGRISRLVLVIDEAQDMDEASYELVQTLMEHNEEMRLLAVGDDDQNIYEFRGSSSEYLRAIIENKEAKVFELNENYRASSGLVNFSNAFVQRIQKRLKKLPIVAHKKDPGEIHITKYKSEHLIKPLVNDVLQHGNRGRICVMARTNQDALEISSLLRKEGLPVRLIQSNEQFALNNLLELRYFLWHLGKVDEQKYQIAPELWEESKHKLKQRFSRSHLLLLVLQMIKDFESIHPKYRYLNDLENFLLESRLEDFNPSEGETILVSTMHKIKGMEFDRVFLMLKNENATTDEDRRLLYVAFTRAKEALHIHLNSDLFKGLSLPDVQSRYDDHPHEPIEEISLQLTHKDVWLDFFISRKDHIQRLQSGDALLANAHGCRNKENMEVLQFSKSFKAKLEQHEENGYQIAQAKVNHVLFWRKEGFVKEVLMVLPELSLRKGERLK